MVDFETSGRLLDQLGVMTVAASVDSVERSSQLAEGLRLSYVQVVAEIDAAAVAASTGARMNSGDREFLHATGFLLDPEGKIRDSVYASGPIGRFTASDVLKRTLFEQQR